MTAGYTWLGSSVATVPVEPLVTSPARDCTTGLSEIGVRQLRETSVIPVHWKRCAFEFLAVSDNT